MNNNPLFIKDALYKTKDGGLFEYDGIVIASRTGESSLRFYNVNKSTKISILSSDLHFYFAPPITDKGQEA